MHSPTMPAPTASARVVLLDDNTTPEDFVVDLLKTVFGKAEWDARTLTQHLVQGGRIECGPYPGTVARALLEAAVEAIVTAGRSLRIECEELPEVAQACAFCGHPGSNSKRFFKGRQDFICEDCVRAKARHLDERSGGQQLRYIYEALNWHFAGLTKDQIVTSTRTFPGTMRADLQKAIERLFAEGSIRLLGVHRPYRFEPLSFAELLDDNDRPRAVAPLQTDEVDTGDDELVKCFDNAVWLRRDKDLNYAVVLTRFDHSRSGTSLLHVEIAVPIGAAGADLTAGLFRELESGVRAAQCYRGRALSLEREGRFDGVGGAIRVHRLDPVPPDQLILPVRTRALIDRNVLAFAGQREQLRALGQSTKKGILLYGPPGNGKTHTIRYLASNLPGHTTLIITAEQMGLLAQYFELARLMQPAMLVIEDVDLIARNRQQLDGPCDQVLLNRILNEMDGLAEEADLFFILTTNRPEEIEPALAARPGRIDQAIEVPPPDAEGRGKLVRLYAAGLELSPAVTAEAVNRTQGASAAFIKELMRRTTQAALARGDGTAATAEALQQALDDMLFVGGRLNAALLGGATAA